MHYHFDFAAVLSHGYGTMFLVGILYTLILFVVSWVLAMLLGIILAAAASVGGRGVRSLIALYVAYHRNTPLLVQLLLWYFGIPQVLPAPVQAAINHANPEAAFSVIALSLCSAAYIAENLRSGLRAIPATQFEAAQAMGFSRMRVMRWVIIPQALRLSLPSLLNDTLGLFKGTSLAAVVGVAELTYTMRFVESETFRVFEVFAVTSIIYAVFTLPMMLIAERAARNANLYRK